MADPDYKRLWLQACDAYDRKNPSGCVCKLDPDTDALLGVCGLHADWLQTKLAEERERIAAHFDERDRGPDGKPLGLGFYDPHEPAEIIRALGPNVNSAAPRAP